jgi:hypothetical protein
MRIIKWPGYGITHVEIYRVLDLSGLTNNPRQSKLFIKAGYVFMDNNPVFTIKDKMEIGLPSLLSIRFSNNTVKEDIIMVIPRQYYEGTPQRKVFI